MSTYSKEERQRILFSCRSRIKDLGRRLPALDDYDKTVLVVTLYEYLAVKNNKVYEVSEFQHRANNDEILSCYTGDAKKSIEVFLCAYDDMCYCLYTNKQLNSWSELWRVEHVKRIIRFEEIL